MSEPQADAEKIRNKRLAKLSQASPTSDVAGQPEKSENIPQNSTPTPASTASPATKASQAPQTPNDGPRIRIRPASASPAVTLSSSESLADWEDRTLRSLFRVSLDSTQQKDASGHRRHYLGGVVQELREEEKPIKLSTEMLEPAILEAGSSLGEVRPLHWLLGCWKRILQMSRDKMFKDRSGANRRWTILSEARQMCMNWAILSITTPDVFPNYWAGDQELSKCLLLEPDDEHGLGHEFMEELAARILDDEILQATLIAAVELHAKAVNDLDMDSPDYRTYTSALRNLVRYKALATTITRSDFFVVPNCSAQNIEILTLLGPYFALSPAQYGQALRSFPQPKTIDAGRVRDVQRSLRLALETHQNELLDIVKPILMSSAEAKESILDWFALVVNSNHKRKAIHPDLKTISSDGFMVNVTACLDLLCDPFIDATFSKIDRAHVEYFRRRPRVDIEDETKVNADQPTSDAFYEQAVDSQKSNFISEVFFLALAAHHYGVGGAHSMLKMMDRQLTHMQKQFDAMEMDRHKYVNNPAQLQTFEAHLDKYRKVIDENIAYKHALSGLFLDELTQTRSMQLMRFLTVWILRLVSPNRQFPNEGLVVPLPENTPEAFRCLPEYYLEIISKNFQYILSHMPHLITSTQSDELIMLCITFLRSSTYIKNPYLKAGLVTVLYQGTLAWTRGGQGVFTGLYNSMPFAMEHLLHALMQFYIEAEFMGGHGQFFDKFQVRAEIFQIIKCIWPNTLYRDKLSNQAKLNSEFFIRFVNLLLNDVTFVLDESFTSFQQISSIQKDLHINTATLTPAQREEKESALSDAQGRAKSYMSLTNETVSMLKLFTEALSSSFTMPEIVQRLADMLDYNLDAMVGPKQRDLKVENLESYNFKPRELLAEIADVYINLSPKPNFILAVARDGRSYKPANFASAARILQLYALKSAEDLRKWEDLTARIAAAKKDDEAAEEDLGEVPDEFLDPLMYTLMEDPVTLPTSGVVVDRSTIRSHLLSDPNDPFNRVPLKIEEVKPATELLERIEAFKQEKIGGRKRAFVETVRAGGEEADKEVAKAEAELAEAMDQSQG